MCDGLKNGEYASVSAVSDGLTVENDKKEGGVGKGADSTPKPVANGDARANGHDTPNPTTLPGRKRRLTKLDQEIIAYDQANPGQSLDQLRKRFGGRSKEAIADLLGRTS
jgi:hypothetical protein